MRIQFHSCILIYLVIHLCMFTIAYAENDNVTLTQLQQQIDQLQQQLASKPKDPGAYKTPLTIKFCDQVIPLSQHEVIRRFEKEILMILSDRAQVQLYINRAKSVFPVVENIAKEKGYCSDLKHLAVIESGLRGHVLSRARAKGWWQFMPGTAGDFKLIMNQELDQRADLIDSTQASLKYLHRLHHSFGSWELAMAAYNTGPGRLRKAQRIQKYSSFWELDLYQEAERYVPRILALHHIMKHLDKYDFKRGINEGWSNGQIIPVRVYLPKKHFSIAKKIKVVTPIKSKKRSRKKRKRRKKYKVSYKTVYEAKSKLNLRPLSRKLDMNERYFKRVNPSLVGSHLPVSISFHLWIPKDALYDLKKYLGKKARIKSMAHVTHKDHKKTTKQKKPLAKTNHNYKAKSYVYTVKKGDSLWWIASQQDVDIEQIRTWNHLSKSQPLRLGQKIKLYQN